MVSLQFLHVSRFFTLQMLKKVKLYNKVIVVYIDM